MATVTIRYWAAAKEAAGVSEETVSAADLAGAISVICGERDGDDRFLGIIKRSSFLVDAAPAGKRSHDTIALQDGAVIEVLPAFAGG